MKFKNNQKNDVYIDLGGLVRIAPGETVELKGLLICPPLTPVEIIPVQVRAKPKKPKAKSKKSSTTGTSGTI